MWIERMRKQFALAGLAARKKPVALFETPPA